MELLPPYAELHCLSNFSFLRGASHPEELVERAHGQGYAALALTDECSLAGAVRAHVAAREMGLKLLLGTELTLLDGIRLVVYATDRSTYGDLAQLITRGRRKAVKGRYALQRSDVAELAARCLGLWLPASDPRAEPTPAMLDDGRWMAATFADRGWLAVELLAGAGDRQRLARCVALGTACGLPLVAAGDVHMHVRARRALQDTLTAVRRSTPLSECGYALFPNGERHLRSRARLAGVYPAVLLEETLRVAERCSFSLDELRYEYPEEIVPPGETPASWLRTLTERGLVRRYDPGQRFDEALLHGDRAFRCAKAPAEVRGLVEHELALIAELRFEPYFLTVEDIVAFARSQGILCQGRGSAANSAVCYALGITEVDPSRMSMLFERFISKERNEPPDIDVDFEHQRREEVMQYVYAKYGRHRAALAATLITYRPKSAVRDVGKALGLDLAQVDRLAGLFAWWDGRAVAPERVREAGFDPGNPVLRRLISLAGRLIGFPRHLSQHVGGFVIARDLLERMVPVENAAMADRTVIQWDKDDLDAMGLLKVDCLALGMLSAIRRTFDLMNTFHAQQPAAAALRPVRALDGSAYAAPGHPCRSQEGARDVRAARHAGRFGIRDVPAEDPTVYAMIQRADTVGVFQIESRAQQSMLPRLKPACFYDLVIEVAIVRPGPIQGGMVHPYLRRRQQKEPVDYPSDAVKAVLERTLGVPIFQEQVMQLAIVAAGFTPGESDRLRRSMAAWRRRGGLEAFEQRLIDGMGARGYPEAFARQIYQQILGFGEYGFPESHSASFALLVYVSCWLKCYEPAAFCGALLNSQPMGFYAPAQLVQDARRHGVDVRPPDVTISAWDCALEPVDGSAVHAPALRLGLRMVRGLTEAGAARLVAARQALPFASVADLAHRAALDRRDLAALADGDALTALAGDRHRAVWDVAGVERLPELLAGGTFDEPEPALDLPTEGQEIVADYRRLGLTLRRHPLALLRAQLASRRLATAAEIARSPHGRLVRTAGIVIGRQRPDTASGVVFITLEDESGTTNVIVWRDLGYRQRREMLSARLLGVLGRIEREGEVVHLLAGRLLDLTPLLGALPTRSRDFH